MRSTSSSGHCLLLPVQQQLVRLLRSAPNGQPRPCLLRLIPGAHINGRCCHRQRPRMIGPTSRCRQADSKKQLLRSHNTTCVSWVYPPYEPCLFLPCLSLTATPDTRKQLPLSLTPTPTSPAASATMDVRYACTGPASAHPSGPPTSAASRPQHANCATTCLQITSKQPRLRKHTPHPRGPKRCTDKRR